MTAHAAASRTPSPDVWVAGGAVAVTGVGVVAAAAGAVGGSIVALVLGGVAAATGLLVLLGAGWADGLLLTVLAVPLPALYDAPGLRIAAVLPLTALAVCGWLLHQSTSGHRIDLGSLPVRSVGALFGVFVVATLFAEDVAVSARELVNLAILFALLVAATDSFRRNPKQVEVVVWALIFTGFVCGAFGALETVGIISGEFPRYGTPFNRAALGFGQPNALAMFLALVLPLAVHAASVGRPLGRAVAGIATLVIAVGLFGTFSRGGWLGVWIGAVPLWFVRERRYLWRLTLLVLVAGVALDLGSGGMIRDTAARTVGDWSIEQRAALMATGVLTFLANPIIGVGPGGFVNSIDQYGLLVFGLQDWQSTPHNAYIQVAAETGVVGLVAFVWMLGAILLVMMRGVRDAPSHEERSLRRALLWSFGILIVGCLLDWPFPHGTGQVSMLLMAAGCARPSAAR